jgi:3,4-dihydroxy 2-butanone 4-phosphate synthase
MTENGQFVIILDSQDRENEGDLIIAADAVTDAQMAFLVRYSRYIYIHLTNTQH